LSNIRHYSKLSSRHHES